MLSFYIGLSTGRCFPNPFTQTIVLEWGGWRKLRLHGRSADHMRSYLEFEMYRVLIIIFDFALYMPIVTFPHVFMRDVCWLHFCAESQTIFFILILMCQCAGWADSAALRLYWWWLGGCWVSPAQWHRHGLHHEGGASVNAGWSKMATRQSEFQHAKDGIVLTLLTSAFPLTCDPSILLCRSLPGVIDHPEMWFWCYT